MSQCGADLEHLHQTENEKSNDRHETNQIGHLPRKIVSCSFHHASHPLDLLCMATWTVSLALPWSLVPDSWFSEDVRWNCTPIPLGFRRGSVCQAVFHGPTHAWGGIPSARVAFPTAVAAASGTRRLAGFSPIGRIFATRKGSMKSAEQTLGASASRLAVSVRVFSGQNESPRGDLGSF
jgi:hypothetical protein